MAKVLISESHNIFPEQRDTINERFTVVEYWKIPKTGWSYEEMEEKCKELIALDDHVVFVSPVAPMVKILCLSPLKEKVLIFHNDNRRKEEVGGDIVVTHLQKKNWRLV